MSVICIEKNCKKPIKNSESFILCAFGCSGAIHSKCSKLTSADLHSLNSNHNIKYVCNDCCEIGIGSINKKLSDLKDALNKLSDINIFKVKEIIKENVDNLEKSLRNIKADISSELQNKYELNKVKPISYADTLKLPLIVKPKEKNQNSAKTMKEIKKNINPTELSVEVNNIYELKSNGAISISCENKISAEKIKTDIQHKLGENYEIQLPYVINPKILAVGINENLNPSEIENAIKLQNKIEIKNLKCVKVFESKSQKNVYNAIIEIDGSAFKKFIEDGKINIKWNRCKVFEMISVLRCHKCFGYNHKSVNCTTGSCCYKCGKKGHIAKECSKNAIGCLNCCRAKNELNLTNIRVDHDTKSIDCPIFKKKLDLQKSKIIY